MDIIDTTQYGFSVVKPKQKRSVRSFLFPNNRRGHSLFWNVLPSWLRYVQPQYSTFYNSITKKANKKNKQKQRRKQSSNNNFYRGKSTSVNAESSPNRAWADKLFGNLERNIIYQPHARSRALLISATPIQTKEQRKDYEEILRTIKNLSECQNYSNFQIVCNVIMVSELCNLINIL